MCMLPQTTRIVTTLLAFCAGLCAEAELVPLPRFLDSVLNQGDAGQIYLDRQSVYRINNDVVIQYDFDGRELLKVEFVGAAKAPLLRYDGRPVGTRTLAGASFFDDAGAEMKWFTVNWRKGIVVNSCRHVCTYGEVRKADRDPTMIPFGPPGPVGYEIYDEKGDLILRQEDQDEEDFFCLGTRSVVCRNRKGDGKGKSLWTIRGFDGVAKSLIMDDDVVGTHARCESVRDGRSYLFTCINRSSEASFFKVADETGMIVHAGKTRITPHLTENYLMACIKSDEDVMNLEVYRYGHEDVIMTKAIPFVGYPEDMDVTQVGTSLVVSIWGPRPKEVEGNTLTRTILVLNAENSKILLEERFDVKKVLPTHHVGRHVIVDADLVLTYGIDQPYRAVKMTK